MTTCARQGCPDAASHSVAVRVWAIGHRKVEGQHAEIDMGLRLCGNHARELTPESLITDDAWETISEVITSRGGVAPDRDGAEILIRPLHNA